MKNVILSGTLLCIPISAEANILQQCLNQGSNFMNCVQSEIEQLELEVQAWKSENLVNQNQCGLDLFQREKKIAKLKKKVQKLKKK